MKLTTILGAAIGSALDGNKGDDSTLDGALEGAAAATLLRWIAPMAVTYATGWAVLKGAGMLKNRAFGRDEATA